MRRIFIIRHGNTFETSAQARRIGAGTDLPLVESGHAQAERLGAWFAASGLPIRVLHASPLLRARQTAAAIAAATGHALDGPLDWLNEIDHGPDEGQPEAQVIARIGQPALTAWDERGIAPPGWRVDAPTRIAAWKDWFAQRAEGCDLLVTSNGAARFALLALAQPANQSPGQPHLKLRTGAFGEIAIDTDGKARLVQWDQRP